MQYLKEMPNGQRVSVDHYQWMKDSFDKAYVQIIATSGLTIYRVAGVGSRVAEPRYKYGGRGTVHTMNGYRGN